MPTLPGCCEEIADCPRRDTKETRIKINIQNQIKNRILVFIRVFIRVTSWALASLGEIFEDSEQGLGAVLASAGGLGGGEELVNQ